MPPPLIPGLPFADGVLAAMITPAVLITACGTLTVSTSNRLGRVVDRVRKVIAEAEGFDPAALRPDEVDAKRDLLIGQIAGLARRMRLLQSALMCLYAGIGLLVATSLLVGLKAATNLLPEWLPTAGGLLGASALLAASVFLVREVRVAVHGTLLEMAFARRVVSRAIGRPAADRL